MSDCRLRSSVHEQALTGVKLRQPRIPVYCNATGEAVGSADDAAGHIAQAICAPVRASNTEYSPIQHPVLAAGTSPEPIFVARILTQMHTTT